MLVMSKLFWLRNQDFLKHFDHSQNACAFEKKILIFINCFLKDLNKLLLWILFSLYHNGQPYLMNSCLSAWGLSEQLQ